MFVRPIKDAVRVVRESELERWGFVSGVIYFILTPQTH